MQVTYPFSQEEAEKAYREWGANCGPNALAFALGKTLDEVRPLLEGFDQKKYTNPTMMRDALRSVGAKIHSVFLMRDDGHLMFHEQKTLVRIQWHGPWTDEGVNPKWRYRQTHWICTVLDQGEEIVFDCNGGLMTFDDWKSETVPLLTKNIPKADGCWSPTHVWRVYPDV